ncbi:AIPR family protein [Psychrobacter sp. NPDC077938]|uniref:AIPR family protein n=1 Tax=Psychrobacter sp. NPDC077938 TaxID=3364494 RepID=UPI0037CA3082
MTNNKVIGNRIILGILDEFEYDFEFKDDKESKSFEKLVNYVVLSKIDPEVFSDSCIFDSVDVDKKGTFGIDTFALFINDNLITSIADIEQHQKTKRMDIRIVFIQTKRSSSFDSGDFLKFTTAVENFFSSEPSILLSEELSYCKELVDELFQPKNARLFSNRKPKCDLYFAITGNNTCEESVSGIIAQEKKSLCHNVPEMSDFDIRLIDADYIIDSYNELENKHNVTINFEKNISCGSIVNVEQSFIGYLPVVEFLKLITGSDGNIRKNIFYENVRDFQGQDNSVNSEISETLLDPQKIDQFLLLNNGVTIVAKEFKNIRSSEYEICDYYIVNGCQTSNVIYKHASNFDVDSNLNVPIKIVHTTNNNVITSLIKSTNRQTPVPDEAFVSLEKFHKRLQEFYKRYSQDCFETLYYERRSKEFSNGFDRIEKPRIVNLHGQIRSFTSIVLGEPQLAMSNNPTSILKEHGKKMFQDDHIHEPYFLSSLLLYLFYSLRQDSKINGRYVISRYWICWIARVILFEKLDIGNMNSEKTKKICEVAINELQDRNFAIALFKQSSNIFEHAKKIHREENGRQRNAQLVRLKAFRDITKNELLKNISQTK